jgi:hypothetical protein
MAITQMPAASPNTHRTNNVCIFCRLSKRDGLGHPVLPVELVELPVENEISFDEIGDSGATKKNTKPAYT